MHDDAGFVVRCTATIETAIPLSRLKRVRLPRLHIAGWLHVVMGVEQHGRLSRRLEHFSIDVRVSVAHLEQLDIFESSFLEQSRGRLGAGANLLGIESRERNAGDPDQLFEVFEVGTLLLRSEERRVGKECRSRWSPYH